MTQELKGAKVMYGHGQTTGVNALSHVKLFVDGLVVSTCQLMPNMLVICTIIPYDRNSATARRCFVSNISIIL